MKNKREIKTMYNLKDYEINILDFIISNKLVNENFYVSSVLIAKIFKIDRHKTDRILKKLCELKLIERRSVAHKRYYDYFIGEQYNAIQKKYQAQAEQLKKLIDAVYNL